MKYLNNYLDFMKLYRSEIKNTKTFLLVIANIWLLLIFWKILLISDASIINNNATLTKASLLLQPILSILGIDVLSPNMLKMMVLTFIVMATNLSILYFNQVASIIVLTVFARYGHKSYTNYLKNQENLSYLGFESKKEIVKQVEPSRIVIENASSVADTANHTHWGVWLVMGLAVVACFGLLVYSHNSLSNNIVQTNENVQNVNNSVKDITTHINERITRNVQQIDYNNDFTIKMVSKIDNKVNLIDNKVINLENTVQNVGESLVKVNELGNSNVLKLSQQSLSLSQQANEALAEIADASNTVEATTIGLARIWEIVKGLGDRVEVTETRIDSLLNTEANTFNMPTSTSTPRGRISNMVLNQNNPLNIKKANE